MSIAGLPRSNPALKISSTSVCPPRDHPSADSLPQKPLYHGVSDRPLGWKMRCKTTGTQNIKRFHGRSGASSSWDGLRRDPELWLPNANCFVHLHGPTSSQRGPAFRIPLEAVHATQSSPLLERFVPQEVVDADDAGTAASCKTYNIYIPSPNTLDRAQAYLDHLATRNFIAWMLGRPLVGNHLGEALVGLLESMKKYRSPGLDHIATLMDYMSHMGYDDLQNHPDHVLAVLFLAERYQFRDLWIDAHAHGVGMHDRLYPSPGYKYISEATSRSMANSRFELHMRLDNCGRILSTFLSDEISETMLGLPSFARDHLDKFRSFLQMYHIAKHGYYPPQGPDDTSASFPKHVYDEMRHEFQMLYNFLADTRYALNDSSYAPQVAQSGVGLLPALKAFDARREYRPLPFALPLLPEGVAIESPTSRRRNIWFPSRSHAPMSAKMVTVQALAQATNCQHPTLLECSLVRAYRNFEKQSVLEGADKQGKLTHVDARKLRWLLIYGILQVLLEATQVPEEVRGLPDVPYHLGHVGRGPLPWEEVLDARESIQTQVVQARKDWVRSRAEECIESPIIPSFLALHVKSDLNQQISPRAKKLHSPPVSPAKSEHMERSHTLLGSSTVKKAMNALENLPVLRHAASHKQLGRSISASDNTIPLPHVDHLDIITRPATASGRAPDRSLTIAAMVDPHHTGRRSPDSERTCAGSVDRDDSTADWSLTSTMEDAVVSPATSTTCSVSPCPSMQSRSSKRSTPRRSIEDSSTRGHASSSDYAHVLAPDEVIIVKGAEPQYGQSSQHRSGPDIQTRYNEGTTLQDSEGALRPTRLRPRPQHLNLTEAKKPFAASSGLMSPKSPLRTPRTPKTPLEITAELTGAMKQVEAAFAKGVAEFAQQHNVEMPSTPVVCPSADALSAMHSTPSSPSTTRAAAITPPVVTISAS